MGLTSVYDNSCTPQLEGDNEYVFALQHVCKDDRYTSPMSIYSDAMTTSRRAPAHAGTIQVYELSKV